MPGKNGHSQAVRRRISFKLKAPSAEKVQLVGTFNDWNPDARVLRRDDKGTWKTSMMLAPGRYEFRYLVDGEWSNDPESELAPNAFGSANNVMKVL